MHHLTERTTMQKRTLAGLVALGLAVGVGLPLSTPGFAGATTPTQEPYTVALWSVPTGADPLTVDQPYVTSTPGKTLDALDSSMVCGTTYQVDVYRSVDEHGTPVSSLWDDGVLHPGTDGGFLAYDVLATPYKVVTTDPCEEPTPTPTPTPPAETPTPTPTPTTTPVDGKPTLHFEANQPCAPHAVYVEYDIPVGLSVAGYTGKGRELDLNFPTELGTPGPGKDPNNPRAGSWTFPVVVLDGYSYDGPKTVTLYQEGPTCPPETPTPTPTDTPTPVPSTEPTTTPTASTPTPPASTTTPVPVSPSSTPSGPVSSGATPRATASAVPVADDTTPTGTLAYTGSEGIVPGLLVALALAAIGVLVLVMRHRARAGGK